ncbi:DUF2441 domain-containing protein [Arsenophonus nasoniae]|uniref:DUF2441 domain-containing protein n=1 Tax=Arsenophonus nasoniae TaxID=638 RepID=A0A4V1BWI0_9GAMM|nr:DUF2441 domain-containing protein [Arsenophonus nasoniae]QBY42263.1 hypothetical protein ArsFIN_08080 [Arsenophonus nasoniae]WGM06414.1 DUF2441 domain-containing protein [Arsenophonus nasoniae]WGM11349.1 DUF2441 domain-containing protein [Arsenophonus nasoniae]WGM16049.1 DUF2441 domain-containing protein [Arsenophonus nasoniae]
MEVYYTVDSAKGLFQFCEVELYHYTPKEAELAAFLNQIHPEGLSKHGYINLCNPSIMMGAHTDLSQTFLIGLVFELVRRSYFPEKPPRYQSLFACQQISEVKQFRELLADEKDDDEIRTASIYEVITEGIVHRGDMRLLNSNCPVLELYRRAHLYWSGEASPLKKGEKPFWECLIPLPALIGQQMPW